MLNPIKPTINVNNPCANLGSGAPIIQTVDFNKIKKRPINKTVLLYFSELKKKYLNKRISEIEIIKFSICVLFISTEYHS